MKIDNEYIENLKAIAALGGARGASAQAELLKYNSDQERDENGRFGGGGSGESKDGGKGSSTYAVSSRNGAIGGRSADLEYDKGHGGVSNVQLRAEHEKIADMHDQFATTLREQGRYASAGAHEVAAEAHRDASQGGSSSDAFDATDTAVGITERLTFNPDAAEEDRGFNTGDDW
jgi:hypothetical protein